MQGMKAKRKRLRGDGLVIPSRDSPTQSKLRSMSHDPVNDCKEGIIGCVKIISPECSGDRP